MPDNSQHPIESRNKKGGIRQIRYPIPVRHLLYLFLQELFQCFHSFFQLHVHPLQHFLRLIINQHIGLKRLIF